MPKMSIEMEVYDFQEISSTLKTTARRIDWVLENKPPKRPGEAEALDTRAKHLTLISTLIDTELNKRVLNAAK